MVKLPLSDGDIGGTSALRPKADIALASLNTSALVRTPGLEPGRDYSQGILSLFSTILASPWHAGQNVDYLA
jgi:hypothetical protein